MENIMLETTSRPCPPHKNLTFQFLKAILIVMVIDCHSGSRLGLFASIFPYDSFFMPLFVFCSGYFYKKRPFFTDCWRKFKSLLVPYIVWSVLSNLFCYLLQKLNIVYWYKPTIQNFARLLWVDPISTINGAGWFALMLFHVAVIYSLLRNTILKDSVRSDYLFLLASIVLGMGAVFLCMEGRNALYELNALFRAVFFLQFFHIGYMFRRYWEPIIQHFSKFYICCLCVLINEVLIGFYGSDILFCATAYMESFNSWFLPLITSVTGGLFWYTISSFLAQTVKSVTLVNFVADNTFNIMMSHLFFLCIPTFCILFSIKSGHNPCPDYDIAPFLKNAWNKYTPGMWLIDFFLGLLGSLAFSYLIQLFKKAYRKFRLRATASV